MLLSKIFNLDLKSFSKFNHKVGILLNMKLSKNKNNNANPT